jgi:lysophospholipase L1-like esterase
LLEYKIKSINPELLKLESSRVKIIDIHNFGWDKYPDLSLINSPDQFHLNDEGYINWTNAFLSKIRIDF